MSEGTAKRWMAARGWQPFAFQQQVWQAMAEGRSGLLHATTGAGKTYAVWLGALEHFSALLANSSDGNRRTSVNDDFDVRHLSSASLAFASVLS